MSHNFLKAYLRDTGDIHWQPEMGGKQISLERHGSALGVDGNYRVWFGDQMVYETSIFEHALERAEHIFCDYTRK